MKKVLMTIVTLVLAFVLVACGGKEPLPNETKNFWVTGQFASWGDAVGNDDYLMEAVAPKDERLKSVYDQIKKAEWLYALEITFPAGEAGWEASYTIDGEKVTVDGNLTVKVIQTAKADELNIPEWWAQSPESGKLNNLTPDTLYVPPFVEENVNDAGGWNDNPITFEAGTYYAVLAGIKGEVGTDLYFGLIKK